VPTRRASKWPYDRARVRSQSARAAICRRPITIETAEAFRTSWDKVFDAAEHVATWGLEHRTLGQIDAIGVDEIQYSKEHKYLTLVYQIELGVTRLLCKERTIESFQGFFTTMGEGIISKIVFICSDMWEPYLKVIREKCSEALHILDRFHIVAKMNKALDEVRAGESRRRASEGRTPLLKRSRGLLLKREENLKAEQRFRLRDLLRYNLKTVRAYLLKEAFQQLWDYSSPSWAGKFLDEWRRQTMRSRIEPMNKIARSLRQHRELILNYFRAQKMISSGVVEGLNNKAKVTLRKSYGFRTYRVLELSLYHSLGSCLSRNAPTISSEEPIRKSLILICVHQCSSVAEWILFRLAHPSTNWYRRGHSGTPILRISVPACHPSPTGIACETCPSLGDVCSPHSLPGRSRARLPAPPTTPSPSPASGP
jgi:transposase